MFRFLRLVKSDVQQEVFVVSEEGCGSRDGFPVGEGDKHHQHRSTSWNGKERA